MFVTAGITIKSNDNMHIFYEVKLTDRRSIYVFGVCALCIASKRKCLYETCQPIKSASVRIILFVVVVLVLVLAHMETESGI